ncbi:MAG TPA: hypothetical protein VM940_11400 [Chthoniobacterales bacterium]|jgi:hypothetical protein|nr:hypothetical protein [Chthoniobacterales bacterium]
MANGLRTSLLVLLAAGALGWVLPRPVLVRFLQQLQTTFARFASLARQRPKLVLFVIWMVALIPMVHFTVLLRRYAVNVPALDDWAIAPLIVKAHTGQLKLADLFQQQQEARTVLPNLIFLLTAGAEWNVRDQMLVSIGAWWLTAGALFVLLRRLGLSLLGLAVSFWLVVLTLFSPLPYELWILASGFPSFLPLLFLTTTLAVIRAPIARVWQFIICAVLATASTFTLAHGQLLWGLTFPVLLISERGPRWRSWLVAWITTAAVCVGIYFWGYQKPTELPRFGPAVSLLEYVSFILQFLGGGLAYSMLKRPGTAAIIFGLAQLIVLGWSIVYAIRRVRNRQFLAKVMPWFALVLYAIGSAVLAALGRVEYGASYALASRYVPFSIGLTLGLIGLVAVVFNNRRSLGPGPRRFGLLMAAILVLAYLVPLRIAAANTLFFLRSYSADYRLGKGALLFSRVLDARPIIKEKIFPAGPDHVVTNAAALDDLKLLRPGLARSSRLSELPHEGDDGRSVGGICERVTETNDLYQASGWAVLKTKGRPADCVLIGYEGAGVEPTIFAISNAREPRWDIARLNRQNDYLWAGWKSTFPKAAFPPGAKLTFWAFDSDELRLYRLPEAIR